MSDTKFTPGPWTFFEHSWAHTGIFSSGKRVAALELSEVTEETEEALGAELAANAHLIAAAPDLYEALADAVAYLHAYKHTFCAQALCDKVDAALAKAEGRS